MQKLFFRDIAFASALCSLIGLFFSWNVVALICLVASSIVFVYLLITGRNASSYVPKATSLRARAKDYGFAYLLGGMAGLFLVSACISLFIVDVFEAFGFGAGNFSSVYVPLMTLAGLPVAWLDLRRIRQFD